MAYVREDLDSPKKLAALADAVDSAGSGSSEWDELLGDPEELTELLVSTNCSTVTKLLKLIVEYISGADAEA